MRKKILLSLFLLFLAIQFIRPTKNRSAEPGPRSIITQYSAPPEVKHLLEVACFDCHSNNTRYPWYAEVQPVGWWLANHVNEGKRRLNFSEFGTYAPQKATRKLKVASEDISEHEMPLWSYRLVHRDAELSEAEIKILTTWLDATHNAIQVPSD